MRLTFSRRPLLLLPLLGVLLSGAACGPAPREAATAWTQEELTLDNGLRVLLLPHPGSGLVASNVFVGAGSTREEDRYAGSSHFLEHVLFNGTDRRSQEAIYELGDRLGAYNNATTSLEYTHFMMVAPAEKLAAALDLQSDMLLHSTLPEEKFEKERGIVLEELSKDKDDPDYLQRRVLDGLIFGSGTDFARPVLGTAQTIAALPRPDVVEYYRRQYVPANMRLVLMGDFQREEALATIREVFRGRRDPEPSSGQPLAGPPCALSSPGTVTTAAVDAPKIVLELLVEAPGGSPEAEAALALLAQIAGGDKSGRLERALNHEPPVPHENASAALSYRQDNRMLELSAQFPEGADLEEATRRFLSALRSLETITAEELAAARTALLTQELSQLEQLHYYALFQGDRLWHMPENFTPLYLTALESTDPKSLGTSARRLLNEARIQVVGAGPGIAESRKDLATFQPSSDLVTRLGSSETKNRQEVERRRPQPLETDLAPQTIRLENGLTVIHAATTSTRMFALHLLVKHRSLREPEGQTGVADLLHRSMFNTLQASGKDGPSPLARIGATMKVADSPWIPYDDYYTTPLYSFVRLECVDAYYREALKLLAGMLQAPCESKALVDARTEMVSAIQRDRDRPSGKSLARLQELIYPDHPLSRSVLGEEAVLTGITPEVLTRFQEVYLDPEQLVLGVVGNVPRDECLTAIRATLGALEPAGQSTPETGPPPVTGDSVSETLDGGGNQSSLRMARTVDLDPADRWPLIVAVRILSDRMAQDLRETKGLAYSLGIGVGFHDNRAVLTASMGTRPENLEEAEAGMLAYFNRGELLATPQEIETAANKHTARMRMRRVTSMGQAFSLSRDLFRYGDIDYGQKESSGIAAVTPDDVNRVVGRYLAGGPMVTVIAR